MVSPALRRSLLEVSIAALVLASAALHADAQTVVPEMTQPGVDVDGMRDESDAFRRYFGMTPQDFAPGAAVDQGAIAEIERGAAEIKDATEDEFRRRFAQPAAPASAPTVAAEGEGGAPPPAPVSTSPYRVTVLVSMSMGDQLLSEYLERWPHPPQAGEPPVRFAFRGVLDGEKLIDAALRVARLSGARFASTEEEMAAARLPERDPIVVMDPRLFPEAARGIVPALVVERVPERPIPLDDRSWGGMDRQAALEAAMAGSISGSSPTDPARDVVAVFYGADMSPAEAVQRVAAGDRGDIGVFGQTFPIWEEDLRIYARRMAEARVAALDLRPERIISDSWRRVADDTARLAITPASREGLDRLSFAHRLNRDILGHDGSVVAAAGTIYDPAAIQPFDRRVFVFDPMSSEELVFLDQWGSYLGPGVVRNVYVATRLPATDGAKFLQGLVDRLDAPVFVLNEQLARAFHIRHTLTVIEPDGAGGVLRRELPLQNEPSRAAPAAIREIRP